MEDANGGNKRQGKIATASLGAAETNLEALPATKVCTLVNYLCWRPGKASARPKGSCAMLRCAMCEPQVRLACARCPNLMPVERDAVHATTDCAPSWVSWCSGALALAVGILMAPLRDCEVGRVADRQ